MKKRDASPPPAPPRAPETDGVIWAGGLAFRSYGLKVGIRVTRPGLLDRVAPLLPPGHAPASLRRVDQLYGLAERSGSRRGGVAGAAGAHLAYGVHAGDECIASTADLDEALSALDLHLHLYIAAHAPRRVFVHAGVVGWRGRAIVIPGRSMSGKSTLVAALVRAGATYYSDEYAVLDEKGRVHPFPRPLRLRRGGQLRGQPVPVEELGGVAGIRPLPAGLVLLSRYREGATFRPRPLTPGQAILGLLDNTVPARHAPERVLPALRALTLGATAVRGVRGDVAPLVEWLRRGEWAP